MDIPRQTVIVTSAIVAAIVVAGVLVWIWFSPSSQTALPTPAPDNNQVEDPDPVPISDGAFNLNVLQRSGYKALDLRPLQSGQLPIKPPATTGKANPFL